MEAEKLRKRVEMNVSAYHKNLPKQSIQAMSWLELLRWCHPQDRSDFAYAAVAAKCIERADLQEFIKRNRSDQ